MILEWQIALLCPVAGPKKACSQLMLQSTSLLLPAALLQYKSPFPVMAFRDMVGPCSSCLHGNTIRTGLGDGGHAKRQLVSAFSCTSLLLIALELH